MRITIHRGTHEIGGSCVEIRSTASRVIVDLGMPLVDSDGSRFDFQKYSALTGQELIKKNILPNITGFYEWDTPENIEGLLISHPHLDHYGLINYMRDGIPCYMGRGAKRIIDIANAFLGHQSIIGKWSYLESGKPFQLGDIRITPFLMDHSAFDSYAFSLESSDKKILYSGDFREHGRKSKAFYWFLHNAPKGVDALLLEGSLLGGRESVQIKEDAVEESILRAVKDSVGIVFFIASGQNIDRLVSFYKASLRSKRLFVIDLYTAAILDGLKDFAKLPYPSKDFRNIRVLIPARLINLLKRRGNTDLLRKFSRFAISKEEISQNVQGIVMILRQSIINELARLQGIDGATVIYSLWEGYLNEPSMNKLIRFIKEKDMTMIHLHTSGHATLDTLKKVAHRLKPKAIIPIHTYHPDQYESLFPNVIKVSDGVEIHI